MLIGFGVVGQGLAHLLRKKADSLQSEHGFAPKVVGVATGSRGILYNASGLSLDSLLKAVRTGTFDDYPDEDGLEREFSATADLIERRGADVIVELSPTNINTAMPAAKHFQSAIATRKHIVTANKGPLALGFTQLMKRAEEARIQLKYEATIMAGTPVISVAKEGLAGCEIKSVRGIVNGTTNYILTQMESGMSYEDALAEAQRLGYAETDPTADVEGLDAAAKVLIMLGALYGVDATPDQLNVTGITGISTDDIASAQAAGERYKLIATVNSTGGSVKPIRVPITDPLANVAGATNAITFETDSMGDVTVIGAGAGQLETAQAILSDLIAIQRTGL